MQPMKYPIHPFKMQMKPCQIHLFAMIQLFLFVLLYTVKAIKKVAIMLAIPACCVLLPTLIDNVSPCKKSHILPTIDQSLPHCHCPTSKDTMDREQLLQLAFSMQAGSSTPCDATQQEEGRSPATGAKEHSKDVKEIILVMQ
jgi:hypothetical protein